MPLESITYDVHMRTVKVTDRIRIILNIKDKHSININVICRVIIILNTFHSTLYLPPVQRSLTTSSDATLDPAVHIQSPLDLYLAGPSHMMTHL